MKKLILPLIICMSLSATAQEKAAPAPQKEAVQKPNPFVGRSARMEQSLLDLEQAKVQAARANEELACAKAQAEQKRLGVGPVLRCNTWSTGGQQVVVNTEESTPAPVQPVKRKPVLTKAPVPTPVAVAPVAVPVALPPMPRLVGTVEAGTHWVAIVDFAGQVVNIPEGATVYGVSAHKIGPQSAVLNGRPTQLAAVVSKHYPDDSYNRPASGINRTGTQQQIPVKSAAEAQAAMAQLNPRTAPMDLRQ